MGQGGLPRRDSHGAGWSPQCWHTHLWQQAMLRARGVTYDKSHAMSYGFAPSGVYSVGFPVTVERGCFYDMPNCQVGAWGTMVSITELWPTSMANMTRTTKDHRKAGRFSYSWDKLRNFGTCGNLWVYVRVYVGVSKGVRTHHFPPEGQIQGAGVGPSGGAP